MVKRPDPLESTPPAFGEQAARQILRENFGVEASSLKPLAGERDQNFRVDAAEGRRFLFKISNPADGRSTIDMQTAALRHIEQVDPGRGGADHHGGTEFGEQPGGGETDAAGTARPGDHRHPAGQVERRWDGHCPILDLRPRGKVAARRAVAGRWAAR